MNRLCANLVRRAAQLITGGREPVAEPGSSPDHVVATAKVQYAGKHRVNDGDTHLVSVAKLIRPAPTVLSRSGAPWM